MANNRVLWFEVQLEEHIRTLLELGQTRADIETLVDDIFEMIEEDEACDSSGMSPAVAAAYDAVERENA